MIVTMPIVLKTFVNNMYLVLINLPTKYKIQKKDKLLNANNLVMKS